MCFILTPPVAGCLSLWSSPIILPLAVMLSRKQLSNSAQLHHRRRHRLPTDVPDEDGSKWSGAGAGKGSDGGEEGHAVESNSDSSTTSSSGSSDEAAEAYENFSAEGVLDKIIPPLGVAVDLDVFQNPKTRSLHTRAKGSKGPLMCGRKAEGTKPFSGKVFSKHWICKQCEQARPLRDTRVTSAVLSFLDKAASVKSAGPQESA